VHSDAESWSSTTIHGDETASAPSRGERQHLTYAPGLDGVRAFAVIAVVIFHLGASWLPGGFLGVDVFFVLSGFLITSILLTEFQGRGRIDIKNFYLRRARRLLPALFTMLTVITIVTWLFARDEMNRLRGDVIAAVTYCTNWTQIVWNRSYFDQLSRPSLLQHLWSLAVEEQYYLIWPIVLVALLATRKRWVTLLVPVALTAGSLLLMAGLYHVGQDTARVYYGTDTHISPILIGSILAIVISIRRQSGAPMRDTAFGRALSDVCALVGFVGMAWACVEVTSTSSGLYQGGYALVGIASAAFIFAAARPGTITATLLGWAPLVWIGKRSYAIYLWHWPILQLTRPGVDVHWPRPVLIVFQVGVILIASDLSYRFIERPIRSKGFLNAIRGTRVSRGRRSAAVSTRTSSRRPAAIGTVLVAALAVVIATLATAPAAPAGIQYDTGKSIQLHLGGTNKHKHHHKHKRHHHKHHNKHHKHHHQGDGSDSSSSSAPPASPPPSSSTAPAEPPFPRPVRVGFFGDSQGMTLLLNKPGGLNSYITTYDDTIEGCGILGGTITSQTGYTRDLSAECGNWPSVWAQKAAATNPQVAVIEIGAWDVFDDTLNGRKMDFGSPPWDAYFTKQLAKAIKILINSGAQVALMGVPCYRPVAAGGLPKLPERGDDDRTRHVTDLLQAAAAADPSRVFMIHPPGAFCNNPSIATNLAYRWDGTHFYKPGAALMFRVITPQLLAIPQPPPQ
jgi:peptidoglycan/LPS O-acetylase OafA/YrhL